MQNNQNLQHSLSQLTEANKGILAADESVRTITQRLASVNVPSNDQTRRAYRELLITTPDIEKYISGVILFEETLGQSDEKGHKLPTLLTYKNILIGIKVDKGLAPLVKGKAGEQYTQGLDGLADRLAQYHSQGARFTKWRVVYHANPSDLSIRVNAETLAHYAAIAQSQGLIPIVEPEILREGTHTIEACQSATYKALQALFEALFHHKVSLKHLILKTNMVTAGSRSTEQPEAKQVAEYTLEVLQNTVPSSVPSINFLSGGQTPEEATRHLAAINQLAQAERSPWRLNFSFARALQDPCLRKWAGKSENRSLAQTLLLERAKSNVLAASA